ncbi:hypothetical protein CB0940_03199 [Cercospora beticola]|uniref:DUF1993 domain-containing protein n=1 Tax=Cercospora beticola TaxID=122368 RepID=A0A2G5I270_CERBT|nr:hypothetical protein CB0940_03199 [Cercospora beticola]PIA98612.1 hypothetical protein CB0940_03199 [Cercospora beticola]WPB00371.1 hypothetical protein RHO25_004990 [Cercospora beticola]CAK1361423.1 unnamed protein product [Cercospora beticola]
MSSPPMLYSMSIPIFIRQLKSLRQFLQKGENWLKENGHPESKLIEARLAPDMHPLPFQIQTCTDDSFKLLTRMLNAKVTFPPREETTFAGLYARIDKALSVLEDVKPEKFEGLEGKEIRFRAGPYEVKYDGVTYLQEVALANFLFHASIAYALLRKEGVPLGKFDFIGGPSKGMEKVE